jgi:hypothetical protein
MNAPNTTETAKPAPDTLRQDIEAEITRGLAKMHSAAATSPIGDVERFLHQGEAMLEVARRRLIELEMRFGQKRRVLVNRLSDDLVRLENEHQAAVQPVQGMIARLEALRHG